MTSSHAGASPATARPPLVLLSGMLGDESLWQQVRLGLDPDQTVVCLRTDTGRSVSKVAASVLALAPPVFALAGHSFGGIVALEVYRQAPERVLRIAVFSASARAGSPVQQQGWAALRSRTEAGEFAAVASELAAVTLAADHRTTDLLAHNVAMAQALGPAGLLRQLSAQADRPDGRPSLGQVTVPTLVAMGELDAVCPAALQHEVADAVSGSVVEVIEGSGHMTPLEAPDRVATLLTSWLDSAPTACTPFRDRATPTQHEIPPGKTHLSTSNEEELR